MTMHHRLSIFYYVLLDFDAAHGKSDLTEDFAAASGVPRKYQIFMKGLWLLDRHQFQVRPPSLLPPTPLPTPSFVFSL